ncbi:MAG: PLP-dependent lyase/thiolase [Candidatus Shapirobacteria bacterium]|jgi:threonine dehydratase
MTSTPLIKLENFYLKREDKNQTGSIKDRAISLQIENLVGKGISAAVISSTGNAAISALYYCSKSNIKLTIFLSPKINLSKLSLITEKTKNFIISDRPISGAFKYAKKTNSFLLRQSTDPIAQIGYQSVGLELSKDIPDITSIFMPVGSGTTLLGISKGLPKTVKIFAIQPASHCPISQTFDPQYIKESHTITDALSVKLLPLKSDILKTITESGGGGMVVQNTTVVETQKFLLTNNIFTSPEGALALAGFLKAEKLGIKVGAYPVIILTGEQR